MWLLMRTVQSLTCIYCQLKEVCHSSVHNKSSHVTLSKPASSPTPKIQSTEYPTSQVRSPTTRPIGMQAALVFISDRPIARQHLFSIANHRFIVRSIRSLTVKFSIPLCYLKNFTSQRKREIYTIYYHQHVRRSIRKSNVNILFNCKRGINFYQE